MTTTPKMTRDLRRHPLVAPSDAPLAHEQGDPQRTLARRGALALALALALGACAHADGPPEAPASAPASHPASHPATLDVQLVRTASLSAQRLREHVYYLASDELEGRGPATAGLEKAAAYITKALRAAGLRPAFAGAYRQPFEMLVGVAVGADNRVEADGLSVKLGPDMLPYTFSSVGEVKGAPVFAGYGIRSEDHDYDDYAGLDVKGKVVLALHAEPGDDDPKSPFDGRRRTSHASVRSKLLLAREAGAAALLVIQDGLDPKKVGPRAADAGLVVARVSTKTASALLGFDVAMRKAEIDAAYAPKSEAPARPEVTVRIDLERERRTVHNVAGVIGPEAAEEVVVIGAHYDHLGMGSDSSLSGTDEPRIHNGADDNASGTAVVLEVARALAPEAERLKRKVVFVLFAGEEDGLLGSSHFVKSPPFPIEAVAAMVNLDMVGRLREDRLNFMGVKTATELQALARAAAEGRGLTGTYGGDGYGPSDHTPFFAAGAPVLFLFTGAHEDYHRPSDDPDTLYYPGMAKVGAVAADLVSALARAARRPTYVKAAPPKAGPHGGAGRGYGPYFGSIPDFGEPVEGVRLSGVRAGSPADQAGVKKGDVLVEFGGLSVKNLQDFTIALRRHAPGDTVKLKVRRGERVLELEATLSRRE